MVDGQARTCDSAGADLAEPRIGTTIDAGADVATSVDWRPASDRFGFGISLREWRVEAQFYVRLALTRDAAGAVRSVVQRGRRVPRARRTCRNAFTKGTEQEVDFLVDALGLEPGSACSTSAAGPGGTRSRSRGAGCDVVGVDLSPDFVALARDGGRAPRSSPRRFEIGDVAGPGVRRRVRRRRSACARAGFGLLGGRRRARRCSPGSRGRRGRAVGSPSPRFSRRVRRAPPRGRGDVRPRDRRAPRAGHRARRRRRRARVRPLDHLLHRRGSSSCWPIGAGLGRRRRARRDARDATARRRPTLDDPELLLLARRPA